MANLGYIISGAAPLVKKYMVAAGTPDFTVAGCPANVSATTTAGVTPTAAGTSGLYLGLSLDTAVYTTTQATILANGAPGVVSLVVNPDIAIRSRISGSATAGTAMTTITNSVANTGGTAVTITSGDAAPNNPTMLDGTVVCIKGNNVGIRRKITTVSATVCTVVVPFPYTIAVGDVFVMVPFFPGANTAVGGDDLSFTTTPGTLATEARQDVATTTTGFRATHLDLVVDTADPNRVLTEAYILSNPVNKALDQLA